MVRAVVLLLLIGCGSVNSGSPDAAPRPDAAADAPSDMVPTPGRDAAGIPDGLIAWYTMDAPVKTPIADASGHGHDGVCLGTGCPTLASAGRIGGAYLFDGQDDIIRVQAAADLMTTTGFTVGVWVNRVDATPGCVVNKNFGGDGANAWQACFSELGEVSFFSTDGTTQHQVPNSGPNLDIGNWHHIALRWNATTAALFVDGLRIGSEDDAIAFDASDVTIGSDVDSGRISTAFHGMLDDVRIYNRALSDAEIAVLQSP